MAFNIIKATINPTIANIIPILKPHLQYTHL